MIDGLSKLAEMGIAGVCVALIGTGAWMFKEWLKYMKCADKRHEETYKSFQKTINENTNVTKETLDFLKNLNGSLRRVVKEKQNEKEEK